MYLKTNVRAALVYIAASAFLLAPPTSSFAADPPTASVTVIPIDLSDGIVTGPGLPARTRVADAKTVFDTPVGNGLKVRPDAPMGDYEVTWSITPHVSAAELTVTLFDANRGQSNAVLAVQSLNLDVLAARNDRYSTPQSKSAILWPINPLQAISIEWRFQKNGIGGTWVTRLDQLTLSPTDEAAARDKAVAPLADGLPPLADPMNNIPWDHTFALSSGVIERDGKPFFPIGFVTGLNTASLAEAKAIGCNAVHCDLGWNVTTGPGDVDPSRLEGFLTGVRRAAAYGIAVCPLLTGHYVPGWFAKTNPRLGNAPMGSDGLTTGSWLPYSMHYQPFRDGIVGFWSSVPPVLAKEPNILTINLWNEPTYGGTWNKPGEFADYNAASISDYRAFLQTKYGTIQALNLAHNQTYASFDSVQPPHSPAELGPAAWIEWLSYGDAYFSAFFDRERQIIKKTAPSVLLANKKETEEWTGAAASSACNWYLLNASEDVSGVNLYIGSDTFNRDILAGAHSFAPGKPVIVYETNSMPPKAANRTPDRIRTQFWSQLAGGANGMFIYALSGDHDHGLLADTAYTPEARAETVRFVKDAARLQTVLASPIVAPRIAVLYSRLAVLQHPGAQVPRESVSAYDLVRNAHFEAAFLPGEECTADGLKAYSLVVLPSSCILTDAQETALLSWVRDGGRVLAFANSLSTDTLLKPKSPPAWLGLEVRQPAFAGRVDQEIGLVIDTLQRYVTGDIAISGVEIISNTAVTGDLVNGRAIQASQSATVLATNTDNYPAIVSSQSGRVVYCAFESQYTSELGQLIGGILAENLGQTRDFDVAGDDGLPMLSVITGLRQDANDPDTRYAIIVNTLFRPNTVSLVPEKGWKVTSELLRSLHFTYTKTSVSVTLQPREAYIVELRNSGPTATK